MRTISVLLLLPLAVACGSSESMGGSDAFDSTVDSTEDGTDLDTASSTPAAQVPSWWSFDAVVPVVGGVPQATGATVRVFLWDASLLQLCRHDVPVLTVVDDLPPEGTTPAPLARWRLGLGDGTPSVPECAPWASRDLWLGLAPYDDRLDAEAFEEGWDDLSVYSLMVQEFPTGDVWLVGLAGSVDQWDGSAGSVTDPPLADGEYEAHALYLLELP